MGGLIISRSRTSGSSGTAAVALGQYQAWVEPDVLLTMGHIHVFLPSSLCFMTVALAGFVLRGHQAVVIAVLFSSISSRSNQVPYLLLSSVLCISGGKDLSFCKDSSACVLFGPKLLNQPSSWRGLKFWGCMGSSILFKK